MSCRRAALLLVQLCTAASDQHLAALYTKRIPLAVSGEHGRLQHFNFSVGLHGSGWQCDPAAAGGASTSSCQLRGTPRSFCETNNVLPVNDCVANLEHQVQVAILQIKYRLLSDLGDHLAVLAFPHA